MPPTCLIFSYGAMGRAAFFVMCSVFLAVLSDAVEGLSQVVDDVVHVLNAYREPD